MSIADALLPTGANSSLTTKASEFTRRKNWSQSILDELRDLVHVLNGDFGMVYCSPASSELLGYDPSEMTNHLFTEFVHVDDVDGYSRAFRTARDTTQPLRTQFRMHTKDDKYVVVETTGQFYKQCFFGYARVIPVQATDAMDRFLELKMEHEALKQRLYELQHQTHTDSNVNSIDNDHLSAPTAPHIYTPGVPTDTDVSESVSLFTGLNFVNGERARGISLGTDQDDLLVTSIAPSAPMVISYNGQDSAHETQRRGKKKKVELNQPSRVCTVCGTNDSPEWRKGPMGPKTLCNACGLRWAKTQNKKKTSNP